MLLELERCFQRVAPFSQIIIFWFKTWICSRLVEAGANWCADPKLSWCDLCWFTIEVLLRSFKNSKNSSWKAIHPQCVQKLLSCRGSTKVSQLHLRTEIAKFHLLWTVKLFLETYFSAAGGLTPACLTYCRTYPPVLISADRNCNSIWANQMSK